MNWHRVLAAVAPLAATVGGVIGGVPGAIVAGVPALIGTLLVRPSQVSKRTGRAAGKIKGMRPGQAVDGEDPQP